MIIIIIIAFVNNINSELNLTIDNLAGMSVFLLFAVFFGNIISHFATINECLHVGSLVAVVASMTSIIMHVFM